MKRSQRPLLLLALSLVLVVFLSPFASDSPDGLEWVAQERGFFHKGEENPTGWRFSPMEDYSLKGVPNEALSTGLSGILGVIATIGFSRLVFKYQKRLNDQKK